MDSKKNQIISAAVKRFGHFGYAKTTMNELADDLGITKANLYYYYTDKMALFTDVLEMLFEEVFNEEAAIIDKYKKGFIKTLHEIIDHRADHFRKYYALHSNLSENFDWMKGSDTQRVFCVLHDRELDQAHRFFQKAVESGELRLAHPRESAEVFMDLMRSISFFHKMKDMISPIQNQEKIDEIVASQKKAIKFIFEGKLIK